MSDYLKGTVANPDKIYGKSAYEIAVKYGYRGTEEEWSKEVEANRIAAEEARNVAEEMRDSAVTASKGAAIRADDAERSAQAAETSSLMAQEARDFATQAAKQAEQFADQIYKHLPGEEERVVAEEQRLTDEATRVANEAERVSSELSRDATFKGWAQDIASLPSFDSRISANSDRITNLEAGLPSSVWHVDDTAARVKDVPENARPKAIVSKIGGMTYKTENLIDFPRVYEKTSLRWFYDLFTGTVGASTSVSASDMSKLPVLEAGTYYLHWVHISPDAVMRVLRVGDDGIVDANSHIAESANPFTFTITEKTRISIRISINEAVTIKDLMLCKSNVPIPYSPYFEGLRSAKVTAVKSVGQNLIPFPYIDTTKTAGGVTFTLNADRSITFSGDATEGNDFTLGVVPIKQGESYALSIAGSASNIHYQIRFIDASGLIISTATIESGKLNLVVTPDQIPTEAVAMSIHLKRMANDAVSGTVYPMCNKGSTAQPYTPYVEHTLPIPAAVQALDGWGQGIDDNYHNFLDWRPEEGVTEWHQLCAKRPYEEGDENLENVVTDGSSETIYIIDEEIVTDISDLITADNLISVEGGGTLTFENEHGYDMPNTVTYMLKEVTA